MAQTTYLVDANSPASSPSGTGVWSNAYQDPQEAFDQAQAGDTVLIAEGSYTPDINGTTNIVAMDTLPGITVTKRHHSFIIPVPMRVVGGFKGYHITAPGSTDPNLPDGLASNTILHGDSSGTPANIFDNSHHVVHIDGQLSTAFATDLVSLERMVIRDGNTYFSQASRVYGAVAKVPVFSRPTIRPSRIVGREKTGTFATAPYTRLAHWGWRRYTARHVGSFGYIWCGGARWSGAAFVSVE